jgi:3-phosphoshikimate 1-carboxyvinyltransferase
VSSVSISRAAKLTGAPVIPGDKSISHRSLILGALAEGRTEVTDLLESEDVRSTARCLSAMGVRLHTEGAVTLIDGIGARGFAPPSDPLDCGNSGTTMRVLMGVLAGRAHRATLTGDGSLVKRPMRRVAEPLRRMGAKLELTGGDFAPLTVIGAPLHGIEYALPVASAQVKTAIIMAALSAEGVTHLRGEIHSRDHTERMLADFGVVVERDDSVISILGGQRLRAARVEVPGDPSTAAFWMGAASLVPGARVQLHGVSLNPTRIGFLRVLERMGARVVTEPTSRAAEPVGRIEVSAQALRGATVARAEVPSLIDELPLLAVIASQAEGRTVVEGAEELRVKETDRLEAVATNLRAMGGSIEVRADGYVIDGPQRLRGARMSSFHDHRIAMAFSIAGLVADGQTTIDDAECVAISYPAFFETLRALTT